MQGIQNILRKSSELDKLKAWQDSQKQSKRLKAQLANINRHNYLKELERKSGIEKIRVNNVPEGTFGYIKNFKTRERTQKLSKPKTSYKGNRFDHEDFRGLLHADYSEAVAKVQKGSFYQTKNSINDDLLSLENKNFLQDIENFEKKNDKDSISKQSSIEVTSLDLLKDFIG